MSNSHSGDGRKEAVKTYIEQTKLLVTLSSAFLVAPAALLAVFKDKAAIGLSEVQIGRFIAAEIFFVISVFAGYVVLGTIAGYQHLGKFNVYRTATMIASILQILTYGAGLGLFVYLVVALASAGSQHTGQILQ